MEVDCAEAPRSHHHGTCRRALTWATLLSHHRFANRRGVRRVWGAMNKRATEQGLGPVLAYKRAAVVVHEPFVQGEPIW